MTFQIAMSLWVFFQIVMSFLPMVMMFLHFKKYYVTAKTSCHMMIHYSIIIHINRLLNASEINVVMCSLDYVVPVRGQ